MEGKREALHRSQFLFDCFQPEDNVLYQNSCSHDVVLSVSSSHTVLLLFQSPVCGIGSSPWLTFILVWGFRGTHLATSRSCKFRFKLFREFCQNPKFWTSPSDNVALSSGSKPPSGGSFNWLSWRLNSWLKLSYYLSLSFDLWVSRCLSSTSYLHRLRHHFLSQEVHGPWILGKTHTPASSYYAVFCQLLVLCGFSLHILQECPF